MLNISENSIQHKLDIKTTKSYQKIKLAKSNRMFTTWLAGAFLIGFLLLLMPWRQNIQMKGKVNTLLPEQRPQTIHSTIAGRIEKWYVKEGQLVQKGDTILKLAEVKEDYFDPNLLERTANQVQAKEAVINAYDAKADALQNQTEALQLELSLKKLQLQDKIRQIEYKIESNKAELVQATLDQQIADFQLRRTDTLYQKGIYALNDLEAKRLKAQETDAKLVGVENKLRESQTELIIAKTELSNIDNEYANKIAKAKADRFSTLSDKFDSEGTLNKLKNQYENYVRRNDMYFVVAPQNGYITKAIKPGVGEIIKEGEDIVSIVPSDYDLAVELYIKPMDLPLIQVGNEVRFIFDGWPAFVFSGWPNASFGTFSGKVVAIDNIPNEDNLYRLLAAPNDATKPWPTALRVGSGAQGIALLKDVAVWYEVWRRLNGFPPDYYENTIEGKSSGFKPPVKAVAK